MSRWTGTWLQGPGVTVRELRAPGTWPGMRLGLPQEGPGAVATFSARLIGFLVDVFASSLVAGLVLAFLPTVSDTQRQVVGFAVLAVEHVLLVTLTGQTLGMRLVGLQVMRLRDPAHLPGFVAALLRTSLLLLSLGLTGLFTREGRGLHDLAAGTVVVRGSRQPGHAQPA